MDARAPLLVTTSATSRHSQGAECAQLHRTDQVLALNLAEPRHTQNTAAQKLRTRATADASTKAATGAAAWFAPV